jgi:putative addiction module killer protein
MGDVAPGGDGISELRIHYGPSHRICFHKRVNTAVVLLCGGNKSTPDA